MNNLNRITTLASLQAIPIPEDTNTYKHFSHIELDNLTKESLDKTNFQLVNSTYLTARDGQLAIGKYNINYGNDPDMNYMIIWQNSYNKQLSLKYVSGGQINICSNGLIFGDIDSYFHKKHQSDIQVITPEIVQNYISKGSEHFQELITLKEKMKDIEITKRTSAELIGRMLIEDKIINTTQVGIIRKEIENPSFNYDNLENKSVWSFMNQITFASKELHPSNYIKGHQDITNFLIKEYSL